MKVIDLTHTITQDMPVFPGTVAPKIIVSCTMEEHGFVEKELTIYSHTGTHVDAPAHMLVGGTTLDGFNVEKFMGPACVYHHRGDENRISIENLQHVSEQLFSSEYLLIATGWDRYWGESDYFGDFPVLHEDTAEWLLQFGLKGLGLDVISADSMNSITFSVHKKLLGNEMVIVENLKNLTTIPTTTCHFICLPLHLQNADGAPVRAVAVIDN